MTMIELKLSGKCVGCPAIDPDVISLCGDGDVIVEQLVRCNNAGLCGHLEDHLEEKLRAQIAAEQQTGEVPGDG